MAADGTAEMTESDAVPLLRARSIKVEAEDPAGAGGGVYQAMAAVEADGALFAEMEEWEEATLANGLPASRRKGE